MYEDVTPTNIEIFSLWIDQLRRDQSYTATDAQSYEFEVWIVWIKMQMYANRTAPIYCHHWRMEGVEHGVRTLAQIYSALVKDDGIYPDLDEEEGPSNLDHIDV